MKTNLISGILQEPFETVDLSLNQDDVVSLKIDKESSDSRNWLSTNLIDFFKLNTVSGCNCYWYLGLRLKVCNNCGNSEHNQLTCPHPPSTGI